MTDTDQTIQNDDSASEIESAIENKHSNNLNSGFITYYGLYWNIDKVFWDDKQMLAVPIGKAGQGKAPVNAIDNWKCMNFWKQKGVYILYDSDMYPVYAGQVGIEKSNSTGGNDLGARINAHRCGKYRNAWKYFSWFGFLERASKGTSVRLLRPDKRIDPDWKIVENHQINLNSLLSSFEAIIIEGFIPRLNARGGDMKSAVRCDQYEGGTPLSN